MYKTVFTGLLVFGLFFALNTGSASAAQEDLPLSDGASVAAIKLTSVVDEVQKEKEEQQENEETKHVVEEDETLSDIAEVHKTTWQRIYDKNVDIESPDVINPGDELIIPRPDEELEPREVPVAPAPEPAPVARTQSAQTTTQSRPRAAAPAPRGSSAGNGYVYGYCTWYVKSVRSDLPNNLGNANTWAVRAAAQGYATGSIPRAGAVAVATTGYMHVAYVTGVNGDGTVNLSEMNYRGWGVVSSRTAPASQFVYIY